MANNIFLNIDGILGKSNEEISCFLVLQWQFTNRGILWGLH